MINERGEFIRENDAPERTETLTEREARLKNALQTVKQKIERIQSGELKATGAEIDAVFEEEKKLTKEWQDFQGEAESATAAEVNASEISKQLENSKPIDSTSEVGKMIEEEEKKKRNPVKLNEHGEIIG